MRTINEIEAEITAKNAEIEALQAEKERLDGVWKPEHLIFPPLQYYSACASSRAGLKIIRHGLAFRTAKEAELYDRIAKDALEIRGPLPVKAGDLGYYLLIVDDIRFSTYETRDTYQGLKFHTKVQARQLIYKYGDDLKIWIRGGER